MLKPVLGLLCVMIALWVYERERLMVLEGEVKVLREMVAKKPNCPVCPVCPACFPCQICVERNCLKEVKDATESAEKQCTTRVKEAERPLVDHGEKLCIRKGYCNTTSVKTLEDQYLYTLRNSITGVLLGTDSYEPNVGRRLKRTPHDPLKRLVGMDWPAGGLTMTGVKRIEALHDLLVDAYLKQNLNGAFLEAGVWRGGSCVYAKGFFKAYNITQQVFVVDSFEGLPKKEHPKDARFWASLNYVSVPLEIVRDHFSRYNLLDDRVMFVKGWFGDSLPPLEPTLPSLAVLRLDGDMYKSTLDVLCNTYHRLLPGGFWIVDDWNVDAAVKACNDFISVHNLSDFPRPIESALVTDKANNAVWFQKEKQIDINTTWCQMETGLKVG